MRVIWLFTSLWLLGCFSTAQVFVRAHGFFTVRYLGNVAVSEEGKQLTSGTDTVYTVFIETQRNDLLFENAVVNGSVFSVSATAVRDSVEVGLKKNTLQTVILHPTKSNTLWRVVFTPGNVLSQTNNGTSRGIGITGKAGKKALRIMINDFAEIVVRN